MNISREGKNWKAAEVQINQAASFLHEPQLFSMQEYTVESYEIDTREKELLRAMLSLEKVARNNGCKPRFWRRLKKAAVQLNRQSKAKEYEKEFHSALSDENT